MSAAHGGGAVFSPDGRYRYLLTRDWEGGEGNVNFIMLNPSTADALVDDPTIRRCLGFARRWGYGSLTVTNLYALRATDPRELQRVEDPVGPDNHTTLIAQAGMADLVVCAWGLHGFARGEVVRMELGNYAPLHHLGVTKDGAPRHPLYLAGTTAPQPWEQA